MFMFTKNLKTGLSLLTALLIVLSLSLLACGTESEPDEPDFFENGIHQNVMELVDDELMDVIENELEMPIYRGANPPDLQSAFGGQAKATGEGITFMMSPLLLFNTNVPNDEGRFDQGTRFADSFFWFSNQNMQNYTVSFGRTSTALDTPYIGETSYIIGEDDRFTVFGPLERVEPEGTVLSMNIFSGILANGGVEDPHYSLIMIDDGGVSGVIPAETGRSFEDGDGFAEISEWPEQEKRVGIEKSGFEKVDASEKLPR